MFVWVFFSPQYSWLESTVWSQNWELPLSHSPWFWLCFGLSSPTSKALAHLVLQQWNLSEPPTQNFQELKDSLKPLEKKGFLNKTIRWAQTLELGDTRKCFSSGRRDLGHHVEGIPGASKWDQAFLLSPNTQSSCSYGSEVGTGKSHQTIKGHFQTPQKKISYLCPTFGFGDQSCSLKQFSGFIFLLASFRPSSADQLFPLSKLVFPQVKN